MKARILLVIFFACIVRVSSFAQDAGQVSAAAMPEQTAANKAVYDRIAAALGPVVPTLSMPELVVQVALQLLGTPYVGASLESEPEQLQVYLDKTDCILFVELSTCMALTLKGKRIVQAGDGEHFVVRETPSLEDATPGYALLCDNIRNMRYRLGVVDGYASRIHYTSEWLLQNSTNGILREYSREIGQELEQPFYYMSMHPTRYRQLSHDVCELGKIRMMEERLSAQKPYFFVPQSALRQESIVKQIKSGDIVAFISTWDGLDLAHVAIAYEHDGEMHFIHASYGAKKVIIEPKTLAEYATNGIRVARLND